MFYTIGQISTMTNLSISTLRYYDAEGLFPNLNRKSGIRQFSDRELETIRVIECLKKSGLEIKEIKEFIKMCQEGPKTYKQRKALFDNQKKLVEEEIKKLNKTLDMLNFKSWYYETAIKDGNEEHLKEMIPNNLPSEIQELYNRSHKE